MENCTFLIKTFERFYCVKRLVRSILKKYPEAKILIADDSQKSCKAYFERQRYGGNIRVFELENDCGLSAGRNYLIDQVKTEYFVLLDDDFVFDDKTDIDRAVQILKEKNLDILGGYIRNYTDIHNAVSFLKYIVQTIIHYEKPANYIGTINHDTDNKTLNINYIRKQFPHYIDTDFVLNFFVAKTNSIRMHNRWDEALKLQEHTAFFFTAKKKGLKIGFSNEFSVQHKPIKLKNYNSFRGRNYVKIFMQKNDLEKIVAHYDNGEVVVTEYENL